MKERYLLDTNTFIQAKNSYYGFLIVPGFWEWLLRSHGEGLIFSIESVLKELSIGKDEVSQWANERDGFFLAETDNQTTESLRLLSAWVTGRYESVGQAEFFSKADFLLVGYAHAHNYTVVTHEIFADSKKKVKIPNACQALDVRCIDPFEMLHEAEAKFILA